jgi:FkbM family methyltransferase
VSSGLAGFVRTTRRRANWFIRDRFPDRHVTRDVQGVQLVLPWSHRLPDYTKHGPSYGQNLVQLAKLLAESAPLTVLDVGANVGDSALQILNAADGKVLCVEGDTAYLKFLHLNADRDPRVTIVEALLVVDELGAAKTAVRTGGTTRFTTGHRADAMPSLTPDELRAKYPDFTRLRLVKSDTDGYDTTLVPPIARTWSDSHPVLFFEYDPYFTRLAGYDPLAVWPRLAELGYRDVAVWTNGGIGLGRTSVTEIAERTSMLDVGDVRPRNRPYWDVAVVHADDVAGQDALDRLVPPSQRL